MKVKFLRKFSKDLEKLNKPKDKQLISSVISEVRAAKNLSEITQLKKLAGFEDAYRIRAGKFRIGLFLEGDEIHFARVVHRKNIYRVFP